MNMKKIIVIFLSFFLLAVTVPVSAAENLSANDLDVTYSGHTFQRGTETVYTLSATERQSNGEIIMPKTQTLTLTVKDGSNLDLTGIRAEMKSSAGQKDLSLTLTVSSSGKEAKIQISFSNPRVSTSLNLTDEIFIYKGNEKIKSVPFAYDTPYFEDEHNSQFNSLNAWSGTWNAVDGYSFKTAGVLDVYQTSGILTYTYKAQGTQGVKAFHLNPQGNFTFTNGKTDLTNINHSAKAVNTIQLKCKSSYLAQMKKDLIYNLGRYQQYTNQYVFDDIVVEYEDGCYIGGALDPIYLGHQATLKILGKTSLKTTGRNTSSVNLKWQKMSGVSGYCIYRSTKKNSGYKKIKTISSKYTSYRDKKRKSATVYYYKIRPYRNISYKTASGKSKTVTIYGNDSSVHKSGTRPKKASFQMKKSGRRLKITNQKVSGCTGYRIYMKCGKNGKYKRIKQLNGCRKRTYLTKKLKKNKVYYVRIRAYKQISGKKYFGSYSKSIKIRIS